MSSAGFSSCSISGRSCEANLFHVGQVRIVGVVVEVVGVIVGGVVGAGRQASVGVCEFRQKH